MMKMIRKNSGFAYISYVIGVVVLAGAVAAAIHLSTVKATKITDTNKAVQTIAAQASVLLSSIQSCMSSYPEEYATAAEYGWSRNFSTSDTSVASGQLDWDNVPYSVVSTSDIKYLECPGLRIRNCPTAHAGTSSSSPSDECTAARVLGKDVDTVDFSAPTSLTDTYTPLLPNNDIWHIAKTSSFMTQKTKVSVLSNLSIGSTPAVILYARLASTNTSDEAYMVLNAVKQNLKGYSPCLTRREALKSVFLVFVLNGTIDENLCM